MPGNRGQFLYRLPVAGLCIMDTGFRALLQTGVRARPDSIRHPSPCSSDGVRELPRRGVGCGFVGADCRRTVTAGRPLDPIHTLAESDCHTLS